jgi:hypothetical protein
MAIEAIQRFWAYDLIKGYGLDEPGIMEASNP